MLYSAACRATAENSCALVIVSLVVILRSSASDAARFAGICTILKQRISILELCCNQFQFFSSSYLISSPRILPGFFLSQELNQLLESEKLGKTANATLSLANTSPLTHIQHHTSHSHPRQTSKLDFILSARHTEMVLQYLLCISFEKFPPNVQKYRSEWNERLQYSLIVFPLLSHLYVAVTVGGTRRNKGTNVIYDAMQSHQINIYFFSRFLQLLRRSIINQLNNNICCEQQPMQSGTHSYR